jgi:D-alanine-D-alanine ligase
MKRQKILLLVHESLVPPDDIGELGEEDIETFRTEYNVYSTLHNLGHEVRVVGIGDRITDLREAIRDFGPDIAFNLLEEFSGIVTYDHYVVAYLELLRQPYTGCNPRGMMISRDKVLTKQVLAAHRIPSPRFQVFPWGKRFRAPRNLSFPLFVKSATEDASLGISQASIVENPERLRERVEFIHEETQSGALVEEYIDGRELYVGVLGNERLQTLPVWEMDFGTAHGGRSGIATRKVKWDAAYQSRHGIATGPAKGLPPGCDQRIARLAKRIYRALYMSGYARMDLRMRPDGSLFVLEANPNPNLTYGEDLAESAESAGISYERLLTRIVTLGLSYKPEWRMFEQ